MSSDVEVALNALSRRILVWTKTLPEADPIGVKALLHLGNRAAVDRAPARPARLCSMT
jgi:hypothetical protein